jgi:hypothetical protein
MPVIKPDPLNVTGTLSDAGEAIGGVVSDLDKGLANLFIQQGQRPTKPMTPPDPMAALRNLAAIYAKQFVAPAQAPMQAMTRRGQETLDVLKKDFTTPANAPGRAPKPLDVPLRAAKTAADVAGAAFEPLAAGAEAKYGEPIEAVTGGAVPKALVGDIASMAPLPELAALRAEKAAQAGGKVLEGAKAAEAATHAPAGPLSHGDVQSHVTNLTKGWKANMGVHVVPSIDHLPPEVAAAVKADGMADKAAAFVGPDGKTVYMLSDRVKSRDAVSGALFHETLGHMGLNAKYGEQLDGALGRIMDAHPGVKQDAERYLAEHPDAYAGDPNRHLRAVEEVLAAKSEQGVLDTTIKDHLTAMIKQFARHMGFDLQMTDKELAAILRSAQNKVTGGAGPKIGTTGNRYIFIGKEGEANVNRIPEADRHEQFKGMVPSSTAERMLREGYDPETVRQSTGWWQDPADGHLKWEIDDSQMKVRNWDERFALSGDRAQAAARGEDVSKWPSYGTVGAMIDHPALYQAHPEIASFKADDTPYPGIGGFFNETEKELGVSKDYHDQEGAAAHELQHGVQFKEGWPRGTGPDYAGRAMTPEQAERFKANKVDQYHVNAMDAAEQERVLKNHMGSEPFKAFVKHYVQHGAAPADMKALRELEDKLPPDLRKRMALLRHNMARWDDNTPAERVALANAKMKALRDKLAYETKAHADFAKDAEAMPAEKHVEQALTTDKDEFYRRNAGEYEARDTEGRQKLSAEERRQLPPRSSEPPIPKRDLIIRNSPKDVPAGIDASLSKKLTNLLTGRGGPEKPGKGVEQRNRHGFLPELRVKAPKPPPEGAKPKFTQATTNANAGKQIAEITPVLDKHKNATKTPAAWTNMMADALASDEVPVPPYSFIRDINGDGSVAKVKKLTPGQIEDANHGFENAKAFRKAYTSGEINVAGTGNLFMWSFLSRGVSPYTQEGLFIDAFDGAEKWIDMAAKGEFDESKLKAYDEWVKTAAPKGSGQPGAGAIHNLGAFGRDFLLKMGEKGEDGVTHLQRLHDMMCDPKMTGQQIRREFATFGQGVGIDNKVVSFTLLVAGHPDVMVLDRVQIRQLWDDGRFKGQNLYDGRKVDGKPLAGSALSEVTYGARGLLVYEAIERGIAENMGRIYGEVGRPNDASVGRYHWETWVADSQQEASHGTLDAILAKAQRKNAPLANVMAKQGEYGAYEYGAEYGRDHSGTPYYAYKLPSGQKVEFTVPGFRKFLEEVKKPSNKVVNSKFKVTDSGNAPWYERADVNRDRLEELARQYADRQKGNGAAKADAPVSGPEDEADRSGLMAKMVQGMRDKSVR